MDLFKKAVGISPVMKITEENYIIETGRKHPYRQANKRGGESLFAVCPECENPIQIIGLFKDTAEGGRKPYGKHSEKTIPGIATYHRPDYLDCSYSNPKWEKDKIKRVAGSRVALETLTILREQFDRVIYILSKDIEVYISYHKAETMLQCYLANEGWRYRVATLNNLPWVFGEVIGATPLFGRKILRDGILHAALHEKCPEVLFIDDGKDKHVKVMNQNGKYLDLHYLLMNHCKRIENDHLYESVDIWVYRGGGLLDAETILKKTVRIQTDYFMNMIQLPTDKAKRNQTYLDIAQRMIPPSEHPG